MLVLGFGTATEAGTVWVWGGCGPEGRDRSKPRMPCLPRSV